MKLCKDCNRFRLPNYMTFKDAPKCYHPSAETAKDMVFGQKTFYTCSAMRNSADPAACGPNAQHYDPISNQRQT